MGVNRILGQPHYSQWFGGFDRYLWLKSSKISCRDANSRDCWLTLHLISLKPMHIDNEAPIFLIDCFLQRGYSVQKSVVTQSPDWYYEVCLPRIGKRHLYCVNMCCCVVASHTHHLNISDECSLEIESNINWPDSRYRHNVALATNVAKSDV